MALMLRLLGAEAAPVPPSRATLLPHANHALNAAEVREQRVTLQSTPLQINVDLTGVCNVHPPCTFCSGKNVGYNYRPIDLSELDRHRFYLDRCDHVNDDSFGEPLSHPQILDAARQFTSSGQRFTFVSNGLLLTPPVAEALARLGPQLGMHVSFNAATPETFYKLTGKSFATVVTNVRRYVELFLAHNPGESPEVVLTFIVMAINRHEVEPFIEIARSLGVRVLLAPLHDRPSRPLGHFGYDFVYEREMLPPAELECIGRDAQAIGSRLGVSILLQWDAAADSAIRGFEEPGVDIPCLIPWRFLHLQQHSNKVYACPYHKRPIGDLSESSIDDIWNGPTAIGLRTALAQAEIPQFCWNNAAGCPLIHRAKQTPAGCSGDIVMGINDQGHLGHGWHGLEEIPERARWTSDRADFRIAAGNADVLAIRCLSYKPDLEHEPARGRLEIAGCTVGGFEIAGPGWQEVRFPLANAAVPDNGTALSAAIVMDNCWVPAESLPASVFEAVIGSPRIVSGSRDTRTLGIVVQRIWVESAA
jgi:MoaA/NifB/PqqE/SkfB family radical SAM enzyme